MKRRLKPYLDAMREGVSPLSLEDDALSEIGEPEVAEA
jgi:hypothetical protein